MPNTDFQDFEILSQGLIDKELPNIFPIPSTERLETLFTNLGAKSEYSIFKFSDLSGKAFICDFKNLVIPGNNYKGTEYTYF